MKISANSIRAGNILVYQNALWSVTKMPEHTKPGKGGAFVQVEMKNLKTGTKINERFNSTVNLERAHLETKDYQFLYPEGDQICFMDLETFEQITTSTDIVKQDPRYLTDNMVVAIDFFENQPISIDLPNTTILEITETDPVIKGSTVTSSHKPALLSNGVKITVPPYLTIGEKIVVKTENDSFVERAK